MRPTLKKRLRIAAGHAETTMRLQTMPEITGPAYLYLRAITVMPESGSSVSPREPPTQNARWTLRKFRGVHAGATANLRSDADGSVPRKQ